MRTGDSDMAIGTRRVRRFRTTHRTDEHTRAKPKPPEPEEDEEELAYRELKAAEKRFEDAVSNKRHKTTNREELTTAGKTILKGAGKVVDDLFVGAGRISDSVERDIRKHSIQGQIDNTIIRALMEKGKSSSRGKGKSTRSNVYVEVRDAHGRPTLINIKDIPSALRGRRR